MTHDPPAPAIRELQHLDDLSLDPRNANQGTARGRGLLRDSLTTDGAARSIVADRHGVVLAGNKTLDAAKALGLPVHVVQTTGDRLVVVQRTDLDLETDPQARRLALADNRIGELGLDWAVDLLQAHFTEGLDLSSLWSDVELERLFQTGLFAGATEDDTSVAPGPTEIVPGDVFALGPHRLRCGDATDPATVAALLGEHAPHVMITDPPYGVAYDPAWRHRQAPDQHTAVGRVANDHRDDWREAYALFPGDVAYVWHAGTHAVAVADGLGSAGFVIRAQIIWSKQHFAMSRGDYHWKHEPCWYAVRRGARSHWTGDRTQTTVWEVPNANAMGGDRAGENAVTGHSTQKPVALVERALLNHTVPGDAVYDPFLGSGTALIAAQKTGRVCLGLDIDPTYVQAAIRRWEAYTGEQAVPVRAVGHG